MLSPHHFKQLPADGMRFQTLAARLLVALGYRLLEEAGVGPDGGRDLLAERLFQDAMGEKRERVLVQCKHAAHSGRSVNESDVGMWQHAMMRFKARGYLLITDVRVTENLARAMRAFTQDDSSLAQWATYWDVDTLIGHLQKFPAITAEFIVIAEEAPDLLEASRRARQLARVPGRETEAVIAALEGIAPRMRRGSSEPPSGAVAALLESLPVESRSSQLTPPITSPEPDSLRARTSVDSAGWSRDSERGERCGGERLDRVGHASARAASAAPSRTLSG